MDYSQSLPKKKGASCKNSHQMGVIGLEPDCVNNVNNDSYAISLKEGGAETGALSENQQIIPKELAQLIKLWNHLPEAVRNEIMTLAQSTIEG